MTNPNYEKMYKEQCAHNLQLVEENNRLIERNRQLERRLRLAAEGVSRLTAGHRSLEVALNEVLHVHDQLNAARDTVAADPAPGS